MTATRMDEIDDLIATVKHELNPKGLSIGEPGYGDDGHHLWGPVTCALREALAEVHRLKAKLAEIARTAGREE